MPQKAHARMKALKRSTMIDPETKAKVEPLLVGECMSSEESAVQESGDERERESSNSEQEDEVRQSSRKKLIKHKLTWRSVEFQKIIESLDRKIDRRRSSRSKRMCLEVEQGGDSSREPPEGIPQWAVELFR